MPDPIQLSSIFVYFTYQINLRQDLEDIDFTRCTFLIERYYAISILLL